MTAALEQELQGERRRRQASEREAAELKNELAKQVAIDSDTQDQLASTKAQLIAAEIAVSKPPSRLSVVVNEKSRSEQDFLKRISAAERERDSYLSEARGSRSLIAELKAQLEQTRSRLDGLSSEKASRPWPKLQEPGRNFLDVMLLLVSRVISKNSKARYCFAGYLLFLHSWMLWIATFHSHTQVHGHHPDKA